MKAYIDLLKEILLSGDDREDRTGVGTLSIFGTRNRYDLSTGKFPLLTTKKLFLKGIIEELLWFIRGDVEEEHLEEKGVKIWSAWKHPDKFPPYGQMWRAWPSIKLEDNIYKLPREFSPGSSRLFSETIETNKIRIEWVDQLKEVINEIKNNPTSRRLVVSAWNPGEMNNFVLPPCHCFYQFYVRGGYLDMQLYVRSNDVFLGMPFNIASYSLLLMMVAQVTNLKPGELIYVTGDTHIYKNHLDQVKLQISREPRELPVMTLNPDIKNIEDFKYEDFTLTGYDPWPAIKGEVAV